jgi:uncharacterized protein YggE
LFETMLPRMKRLFGIALSAIALYCLAHGAAAAVAGENRPARWIDVVGEGRVEAAPDLALLDFAVVTQADTAAAAARENSARMERVLTALRKVVGGEASVSTAGYSIRPLYSSSRDPTPPRITGYEVSNVVHVRTKALTRVGEAIDTGVNAGSNRVQQVTFTLSDDSGPRRSALRNAALQARQKAEALAAALGVRTVALHSVSEQDLAVVRPQVRQMAMAAEAAVVTPVEPGQVEVRARVVMTMEIAEGAQAPAR